MVGISIQEFSNKMKLEIPLGRVGYGNQLFIIRAAKHLSKIGFNVKVVTEIIDIDSVASLFYERKKRFKVVNFTKYSKYGLFKYLKTHLFSVSGLIKRLFKHEESTGYDHTVRLLNSKKVRILDSYFQDFRYLKDFRREFKASANGRPKSEQLRDLEKKLNGNVLGIHVRRGDFKQNRETFGVLSEQYYVNIFRKLDFKKFDSIVIFSDETDWCRNLNLGNNRPLIIGSRELESTLETHWLMGQCDTLICANSTFSLTSAYLWEVSNVVVPRNIYFDPNIIESLTSSYPINWKIVDNYWEGV
jgi:hypothetical protein